MSASPMPQPGQDPQGAGSAPTDSSQGGGAQDPSQAGGQQGVHPTIRACAALTTIANQVAQSSPNLANEMQQVTKAAQDAIRKFILSSTQQQPQAPPY